LKPALALAVPLLSSTNMAWAQEAAHAAQRDPEILWWQGLILGLVQGLTEFIPVSSSGHLNIVHWLMGHNRELTYDVFLHIGTIAALAFYFRHDWKALLTDKSQTKMRNLVFLACVPAAIAGALLRDANEKLPIFVDPRFNAGMLIVAGAILLIADKTSRQSRSIESITLRDALIIGASQAFALIPGVSRSGSTLTAGLFLGLQRADAARFSFLMSLPITLGAILVEGLGVWKTRGETLNASTSVVILGIVASALSGFWAISFLLNYLKKKDVTPFFIWRVAVAIFVFGLFASPYKDTVIRALSGNSS
jgi:undecaprenyl-diphosphatase